jgi:hypothetical protein
VVGEVETSKHISSERESKSEDFTLKKAKALRKSRSRRASVGMDGSININIDSIEQDPVIQEVKNVLCSKR